MARAFQIGKTESDAVSNLQHRVRAEVVLQLKDATRSRGMRQFMTHDCIARNLFNEGFSSGQSGALTAWAVDLTNGADLKLVAGLFSPVVRSGKQLVFIESS